MRVTVHPADDDACTMSGPGAASTAPALPEPEWRSEMAQGTRGRWEGHVVGAPCDVDGCDKPTHARGWCIGHYQRWRKDGTPGGPLAPYGRPAVERFWEKVDRRGPADCWLWTATRTAKDGHGRFYPITGKGVLAHRFAYELLVGPIPDGLVIDHLCRVRLCVNPAHLEPVTAEENTRRGWRDRMAERCA